MRLAAAIALAAGLVAASVAPARAQGTDYDPYSQDWNGMATFVGLAEGMGFEVTAVGSLDWGDLSANDVLVLVYPLQRVDPSLVSAFVHAGGHVVIADDFGAADEAMQRLGLIRADRGPAKADRYWKGNLHAPIATARSDHPVAEDVVEVIANHPALLTRTQGVTTIAAVDNGAIVVAGERGSGRFVAISDPSILINKMLLFRGNVTLAQNILSWLGRDGRARRVVLLRGDVPMYGEPRSFIDDPRAGPTRRKIAALNHWLSEAKAWRLIATAMKVLAAVLAVLLLALALIALPVRRGPKIDGAWVRFRRPQRRDEPHTLVSGADKGDTSNLVLACILRDHVQVLLAGITGRTEPLYTVPEAQLVADVSRARGTGASVALTRVYRRLRALPSRGQAAAPWSAGHLARRDFDALYRDVAELCRSLGGDLPVHSVEPT